MKKQSQMHRGIIVLGFVFSLTAHRECAAAEDGAALEWPKQWTVFAPFDRDDALPPPATLAAVPAKLEINARAVAARSVAVTDPFGRVDLSALLGGSPTDVKAGKVAYVFLEIASDGHQTAKIGLGADWWLQVWLDGRAIADTMENGNGPWPPSACDHKVEVALTPGKHVLAVRFISGSGCSVLALGGPDILRRGQPPGPLFQNTSVSSGNLLPNGGFEEGAASEPFLPQGWEMGKGACAFQAGELKANPGAAIAGRRSLEINTLAGGAVKRKIIARFTADLDAVYEVAFKARNIAGDGYVTVSVRGDLDKPAAEYVGAVAESTFKGAIRRGLTGTDRGYTYFDRSDLFLVIEAHGAIHALLDDVCVAPAATAKQWATFEQQRTPWPRNSDWDTLSPDVVTPHIPWLRPRDGERLRVISVMPRPIHRRTVEMAQRVDMDATPVFFEAVDSVRREIGKDYWIYDRDNDPLLVRKEAAAMERLAAPADGILISELDPAMVPPAMAERVLERVASGAGLVIAVLSPYGSINIAKYAQADPWRKAINPGNRTAEETGYVRLGSTSAHSIDKLDGFYAYGKGRIALVAEFTQDGNRSSYEADVPYFIKAMLWASRKLPDVRIDSVVAPGKSRVPLKSVLPQSALPGHAKVTLSANGALPAGLRLRFWVEDFQNDAPCGEKETALAEGQREAEVEIPMLPAGTHQLHIRLMRDGKGVDWTTVSLEVEVPLAIQSITRSTGKPYYLAGEALAGTVQLSAPLGEGQRLVLRLWDADGRLWREEEMAGRGPRIEFAMKSSPAVVLWHRLQAQVVGTAGVLVSKNDEFAIVRAGACGRGFFDYQMWCMPSEPYAVQEFRSQGVTSAGYIDGRLSLALNNIRPLPAVGYHWEGPGKEPGVFFPYHETKAAGNLQHAPERSPCLTSTNFLSQAMAKMTKDVKGQCRFAPIGYGLAHEWNLLGYGTLGPSDFCFSPSCLEDFRAFLRKEYPSIEALNAGWGTAFRDWPEATPIVLQDALKNHQVSRWVDHRRHMDRVTADFLNLKIAAARKVDPQAQGAGDNFRVGDTVLDSYSGVDYWLLLREAVTWGGNPTAYLLSFSPPERGPLLIERDAAWHPSVFTVDEELLRVRLGNQPWKSLFTGLHGFGFFPGDTFGCPSTIWHAWLGSDLRPRAMSRYGAEAVARIRSGISRFMYESKPDRSGIAILYSRSSEHAATVWQTLHPGDTAQRLHPPAQVGFFKSALKNLGYGYEALAEAQIAVGALGERDCRLLILPFSQALSEPAVRMIRQFVEKGGAVLADVRPAVADQHGKTGSGGALDDVFGVKQDADYAAFVPEEGVVDLRGKSGGLKLEAKIPAAIAGPALKVQGATALGKCAERPAFLVHKYGRGAGLLLNCALPDNAASHEALRALLAWREMNPLFAVTVAGTHPVKPDGAAPVTSAGEKFADAEGFSDSSASGAEAHPMLAVFRNGRIRCFGLWCSPRRFGNRTGRQTVTPPVPGHVYDLRTGAYVGKVKRAFEVSACLESLLAYAVVPYRIERPALRVEADRSPEGYRRLRCEANVLPKQARKENHVIHFRLFAPDGAEWRDFAASVTANNGQAAHGIELPVNAPAGKWKVVALEAISGMEDSATIDVPPDSQKGN